MSALVVAITADADDLSVRQQWNIDGLRGFCIGVTDTGPDVGGASIWVDSAGVQALALDLLKNLTSYDPGAAGRLLDELVEIVAGSENDGAPF